MKTNINDILDFDVVCKLTLNQVEEYTKNGLISQDMNEAYYHLWYNNPHHIGNHIPCQCGICRRKHGIKIVKEFSRLWSENDYYSGGKAGKVIFRESGGLTKESVLDWLEEKGYNTHPISNVNPGSFFCDGTHVRITKSGKRAIVTTIWGYDV